MIFRFVQNKFQIFLKIILVFILLSLVGCADTHLHQVKSHASGYIPIKKGKMFYEAFGQGTPIVIVHGGPGSIDHTYLLPHMLELAKDHKIIFYDQRGSGQSLDTPLSLEYINANQFVDDLEQLRKSLKLDRMILLGHSWGGFLAMNYAIRYPDHLSALILVSTAPADAKGNKAFVTEFFKRTKLIKNKIQPLFDLKKFKQLNEVEVATLYKTLFSVYLYDPNDINQLSIHLSKASAQSGAKVNSIMSKTSFLRPDTNLFPQLKKLNIPTLVVHGEEDIVPIWTAQEIQHTIPHAKMMTLQHCGHFPDIEKPNEYFQGIRAFLTENKLNKNP